MKKLYFPKDKFILQLSSILLLLILIPVLVIALMKNNYLNYSFARSKYPLCDSYGGRCLTSKACLNKDGYNLDTQDCKNDKICCKMGELPLPTPTPLPRLEYQGENISVVAECTEIGSVNVSIIDINLISTSPDGVWTYLYDLSGTTSYLAYTGSSGSNCSATIYGTTNPLRGDRLTIQQNVNYTAGFGHGEYSIFTPTLNEPKYELSFFDPNL